MTAAPASPSSGGAHYQHFRKARTVVLKLGSAVVTAPAGGLDRELLGGLCDSMAQAQQAGSRLILVSSGAVAAGRTDLGLPGRKTTISEKQALAAVGQTRLMQTYADLFGRHGIHVGQMLLTRGDMEDRRRYVNARYTLEELLRRRCIPIINENDTITIDELKFGDNDGLAALVAVKMQADALVILSDVEGLFDRDPRVHRDARLIEVVEHLTPAVIEQMCPVPREAGTALGSGGMRSKLMAARAAAQAGIPTLITHGKNPAVVADFFAGRIRGTAIPATGQRRSSREEWILSGRSAAARRIVVDDGARDALLTHKRSLLPAGIRAVEGRFAQGDVVEIAAAGGALLGRGIVNYSSDELDRIKGCRTGQIESVLGMKPYDEAIHRDNLALYSEQAPERT